MLKVALIGAGRGGTALLEALRENPRVHIVAVCDRDPAAAGLAMARTLAGVAVYDGPVALLAAHRDLDLIINVTSAPALDAELCAHAPPGATLVPGVTARLLWELTSTHRALAEDARRHVEEMHDLYELGLRLSSLTDLRAVYSTIIDHATALLRSPAGSISLFDERSGEMVLAAAKGFSPEFYEFERWRVRPGGLTNHILNQDRPVIVSDLHALAEPVNPALAREGVRSLIATPLRARGRIIGILYVDDFKTREYDASALSVLGLLSGYAALAIERTRLLDETRRMAITDGLTQLLNQQEFLRRLDEETTRALRYGRTLALVELDLDHFKGYNDTFGHVAGNDLLRLLADAIRRSGRASDLYARSGGEEFAIVMPEATLKDACAAAERMREQVGRLHERHPELIRRPVTASFGVACLPEHGRDAEALYQAVDAALYAAKHGGRNRVVAAGG